MCSPFALLYLFFRNPQQMVDKLLCRSAGQAAVGKLPFIGLSKQSVLIHGNLIFFCKYFDNILEFLEKDVTSQFAGFVSATNEYNDSIAQIQEIIQEMSECSDIFARSVNDIQKQIDHVQDNPDDAQVHTDTVLEKVEQTRKTTEDLADIVKVNEENASSIREIMARFSN